MTSYRSAMRNLQDEKQRRTDDLAEEKRTRAKVEAECALLRAGLAKANVQLRVAAGMQSRLDNSRQDLAAASKKYAEQATELQAAKARITKLLTELDDAKLMYQTATEQLGDNAKAAAETAGTMAALQRRLDAAEQYASEIKEAGLDRGGRPRGHAGRAQLEQRWEQMTESARRSALCRHSSDIKGALLDAGCDDWLPSCLALALRSLGLMDNLLRTKSVAEERFKL
eukprot:2672479-Pleurochrysis_carterae.AAC.1